MISAFYMDISASSLHCHMLFPSFVIVDAGQTYELWIGLHAELRMLSEAECFVGTFSSNIARLVFVMREVQGHPQNSTVSVDEPRWHLG